MIALLTVLLASPLAHAGELDGGNALEGYRIGQVENGSGVGLYNRFVVGPSGGVTALHFTARYGDPDGPISGSVTFPVATHDTPTGRQIDAGNLELAGYYHLPKIGGLTHSVGLELHARVTERAYTWVNEPEEFWPGAGVTGVWQGQIEKDKLTWLLRGSIGVHSAAPYDPYPASYLRVAASGAADYALNKRFGLVGEMSVSYWDLSPWELAGLVRVDAMKGVRGRAGIVLPLAVWAGATPTVQGAGVREATLMLDVSTAF